jgi:hypothetical protein
VVKPFLLPLALVTLSGCAESTGPSTLYSSYELVSVDGQPLPVSWLDDGTTLTGIVLEFTNERTRPAPAPDGIVQYRLTVRLPDNSFEHSEIGLNYQIRGNELRIDLCPPLALCITTTELVGTIGEPMYELVLTNYTGGVAGSVYRFVRVLPE